MVPGRRLESFVTVDKEAGCERKYAEDAEGSCLSRSNTMTLQIKATVKANHSGWKGT